MSDCRAVNKSLFLGEECKHVEAGTCCVRDTEMGMFLIKYLFSLDVPQFSQDKERDKGRGKRGTDLFEDT